MRIIDKWKIEADLIVSIPHGNGISLVCTMPNPQSLIPQEWVGETIINKVVLHDISGKWELVIPESHVALLTEYSYQVYDSVDPSVITPTGDSYVEARMLALSGLTSCLTASFVFIPSGQTRFRHLRQNREPHAEL